MMNRMFFGTAGHWVIDLDKKDSKLVSEKTAQRLFANFWYIICIDIFT